MSIYSDKKAETLVIDGQEYAIGVEWSSFQDASESRKERNEKLENKKPEGNYDLRTVFTTASSLYHIVGFSSTDYILKGTKPLALVMLANILPSVQDDNWIGVYKIAKDKYYVIFIQETTIHPDSDAIMPYEDAIAFKNDMEETFSIKEQNVIIHTDKVDHALDSIKTIINSDPSATKKTQGLKPYVFSIGAIHPAVYGVVALAILGGGWYSYDTYRENKIAEEQALIKKREQLRNFNSQKQATEQEKAEAYLLKIEDKNKAIKKRFDAIYEGALTEKPEPWNMMLKPSDFLSSCLPTMNNTPSVKSSWKLMAIDCNANSVQASYKINGDVDVGKFFKLHPDSKINTTGDVAVFSEKIKKQYSNANTGIPETKQEYEVAKYDMIGLFQYNKDIKLSTGGQASGHNDQYYNPHYEEVQDYYDRQRLRGRNTKEDEEEADMSQMKADELEKLYNEMPSKEEISNYDIQDLPIEYKIKLNDFYKKDWLIENSRITSLVPVDNIGKELDGIKGLRTTKVSATISEENVVTWDIDTSLYVRDKAIR